MKTLRALLCILALLMPTVDACPSSCFRSVNVTQNFKPTAASRLPVVTAISSDKFSCGEKTYMTDGFGISVTVDGKHGNPSNIKKGMRVLITSSLVDKKTNLYKVSRVVARTQ